MAVTSSDPSKVRLLRVEEIHPAVARYLDEQAAARDRVATVDSAAGGMPLELVSSSVPPVAPSYPPEATVGEGVFVFTPARNASHVRVLVLATGADGEAKVCVAVRIDRRSPS